MPRRKRTFLRATPVVVALDITLTALSGYTSSVLDRIRSALVDYSSTLVIGQDLVVPSLYGICYSADPGKTPTFSISAISAAGGGIRTSEVLTSAWNKRFQIQSYMISFTVN